MSHNEYFGELDLDNRGKIKLELKELSRKKNRINVYGVKTRLDPD